MPIRSIRILSDEVASQIAAGEVIERPASVVKELLENALDAGARQVTITIEGAGKRVIEIADDGVGILPQEIPLAVARHATSKLSSADDLFHIATLGFRGEALASVGSVARLTLTSRPANLDVGARLVVEGGRAGELEPVGAPVGTVTRVEDLFYNVPARLKFLKQDATERQQIDALVTRYATAYPNVRFKLFQDGRPVLQTSGNGNRREVLASLYGVDVARQMLEVMAQDEDVRLAGFISPVALTRSNRREITLFVNGRWVQDVSLTTALIQAYHTLLMVGRYPMAVLFINIDPEAVDVNVHPAKAEVRFRHPDRIFSSVQRAVRRGLLAYTPVPQIPPNKLWSGQAPHSIDLTSSAGQTWNKAGGPSSFMQPAQPPPVEEFKSDPAAVRTPSETGSIPPASGQPAIPGSQLPLLRLIGQVGATYLVAEGPDGLYLIDQHAAHERVLFERFMAQPDRKLPGQALLEPVILQLPPQKASLLAEQLEVADHLGFKVESFGPNTFLIRAIPALIAGSDPVAALQVLVEDFEEDETPLQAEIEARVAARVCKRAAVKAGQILPLEEQRALLLDLEKCQSPRTCPHGRPTMIHLSADLLERQFGRKGAR